MKTTVENRKTYSGPMENTVYIGRPSIFKNPFTLKKYKREEAIEKYRKYFYWRMEIDPTFKTAVGALEGKVLLCSCKPLACHGDVIVEYLERKDKK
jgi:hypothetical protein